MIHNGPISERLNAKEVNPGPAKIKTMFRIKYFVQLQLNKDFVQKQIFCSEPVNRMRCHDSPQNDEKTTQVSGELVNEIRRISRRVSAPNENRTEVFKQGT